MDAVLRRLETVLDELPPHLRRAAGFILDHPQAVAVTSMRALAGEIGITPPTMLRLARRVGFDDYESFRAVFQNAVTGGRFRSKAASLQLLGEQGGDAGVMASMAGASANNLAVSFAEGGLEELVQAAAVLSRARQAYALGSGALHAMAQYLQYLARAILPQLRVPPANGNAVVEGLVGIGAGDVVVILSVAPYARQALRAAEFARASGATTITITDSRGAPLATSSDIVLIAGCSSPQFYPSMIGVVAMIETLVALVVSNGDAATLSRLETIDRLRSEDGGYIDG